MGKLIQISPQKAFSIIKRFSYEAEESRERIKNGGEILLRTGAKVGKMNEKEFPVVKGSRYYIYSYADGGVDVKGMNV